MNQIALFRPVDDIHLLRRENSYYRRFSMQLEKNLYGTQESLEIANREIRRHHVQQRLRRDLSSFAPASVDLNAFYRRVADAVVEHTLCARVLVLARQESNPKIFEVRAAVGVDLALIANQVFLDSPPPFAFAAQGRDHPSTSAAVLHRLEDYIGLANILWIYDAETGFAIVMANSPGPATHEFQADDEDMANVVLEGLLEGAWHLRPDQTRNPEYVPAAPIAAATARVPMTINRQLGTISEAQITADLQLGKAVTKIVLVEWVSGDYAVFIAPNGFAGFRVLRKFRDRGNRRFKDLMAAMRFIRFNCGYKQPLTIYTHDDPEVGDLVSFALSAPDGAPDDKAVA